MHGFPDLKFLEAVVAEDNLRSRRVLEKCGFCEDGRHSERRGLSERRRLSERGENALKAAVQGLGLNTRSLEAEVEKETPKRKRFVLYYLDHADCLEATSPRNS